MTTPQRFYPIGTPGLPWGAAEVAQWRVRQRWQRSYAEDVQSRVEALRHRFDVQCYGTVTYGDERFELLCVRSRNWERNRPVVLVTGGVHGYETSGVIGALHFLEDHASRYEGRVNNLLFKFGLVMSIGGRTLARLSAPAAAATALGMILVLFAGVSLNG